MEHSYKHKGIRRVSVLTVAVLGMGLALGASARPLGPERGPGARPKCSTQLVRLRQASSAYLNCLQHAPKVTYTIGGRHYKVADVDRCVALHRRFDTYQRKFRSCTGNRGPAGQVPTKSGGQRPAWRPTSPTRPRSGTPSTRHW